ncbi:MAG: flagellar biosynthetic protein FliP [Methylobacter sp.]|nr:MAG: flagellar biosynthetic protein FliP [Methylobacter sp.]PPD19591.1 MAG: flagellar biosynthetic protein FliP [Methylobacter sp.]
MNKSLMPALFAVVALLCLADSAWAAPGIDILKINNAGKDGQTYTVTIQILVLMTMLTLLPALVLSMTSFTRIIIVMGLLRQALGAGQAPSNQILLGLSLFLTFFIMSPVLEKVNNDALQPYLQEKISDAEALEKAALPFRQFMLRQTRESDLEMFMRVSGQSAPNTPEDVPFTLLVPAYMTSELKTAFQIGFLIFIPFLIIDLVVASVLLSMGMVTLSPVIISLPFKIMLFVLADGWSMMIEMLAASFFVT